MMCSDMECYWDFGWVADQMSWYKWYYSQQERVNERFIVCLMFMFE